MIFSEFVGGMGNVNVNEGVAGFLGDKEQLLLSGVGVLSLLYVFEI